MLVAIISEMRRRVGVATKVVAFEVKIIAWVLLGCFLVHARDFSSAVQVGERRVLLLADGAGVIVHIS